MQQKKCRKDCYLELPEEIRRQIDSLIPGSGLAGVDKDEARERFANVWLDKYDMFIGQIQSLDMVLVEELAADDERGAILLTYSGSLISLGTLREQRRWLEYASVKFRADVPELVKSSAVELAAAVRQDAVADFNGSPLKHSSSIYRIAVCPEGTALRDQEQRIREATIFLTNGFVKLNRSIALEADSSMDHFTIKDIVAYVAQKNSLTQVQTRSVIDDYLSTVEAGVLLGERVNLGRFGALSLKLQAARKARMMKNLRTGEDMLIPAKPATPVPRMVFSSIMKEKAARLDAGLFQDTDSSAEDAED
ncbi:MAG: HU family DNA-binding protein [Spirochaetes bacterium]|nr:HU family DNA-binding protein [Spirochaetota bacterium]MBU0954383.1 HU family DNA-binding protein [Spirochaetota bacterium]